MTLPHNYTKTLAEFPSVLRELVEAELAAGNEIVEIASCFPAPPAGAYIKLAQQVSTRPRVKTPELDFYDRNSSSYSGEFTDHKRFFWVLEPARPPEPEVDMDAARRARNPEYIFPPKVPTPGPRDPDPSKSVRKPVTATPRVTATDADSIPQRFAASMVIDYDKWHDGIGYDLSLIKAATDEEKSAIEKMLLTRGVSDWRDVEALAALDTARARATLKKALDHSPSEIRLAVLREAPKLVSEFDKIDAIVTALRSAVVYGGLTQALDEVATFHPPEIMAELWSGVLHRSEGVPVHFAAMLMFLHGRAESAFDWNHRPFFLKFNTNVQSERVALFKELCGKVGVDGEAQLATTLKQDADRKAPRGSRTTS